MGKLGWVAAFVYCACAALRLARFNTNLGVVDKRFFQGLPSPAAAGLIAGFVWTLEVVKRTFEIHVDDWSWVAWALAVFAGLTMVSNVRFYSGKDINLRKSVPFRVIVLIVMIVVVVSQVANNIPELLFSVFVVVRCLRLRAAGGRALPQETAPVSAADGSTGWALRSGNGTPHPQPGTPDRRNAGSEIRGSVPLLRFSKEPLIFHGTMFTAGQLSLSLLASLLLAGLLLRVRAR